MTRDSLVVRLAILVGGTFAVTSLAVMLVVMHQVRAVVDRSQRDVYGERLDAIERMLDRQVERLKFTGQVAAYENDFKDSMVATLRRLYYQGRKATDYPTIFDRNGAVVLHPSLPRGDTSLARTDYVQKALQLNAGEIDYSYVDGRPRRAMFRTFEPWGWLIAYTVPLAEMYAPARDIQSKLVIVWVAVTVVILGALILVLVRFTRPILELATTASAMAAGDLDQAVATHHTGEVGVLARAFLSMRDAIRQKMQDLAAANADLRESEDRYRQIFITMTDGILILDHIGTVTAASPAAATLFGGETGHLTGLGPEQLFGESAAAQIRESAEAGRRVALSFPAVARRFDASTVDTELTASPLVLRGRPHTMVIVRDVSERRRLEHELLQAQKLESIGRLAGGVAHDFNNLLSPILGYSEMLLAVDEPYPEWQQDISQIHRAATRAKDLARQLLAFGRKQVLAMKVVDLSHAVESFEQILRRTLRDDVELVVVADPEPCLAYADVAQLELILMNLAINAQDAMPDGGRLTITTSHLDVDPVVRRTHPELRLGAHVVLSVIDTGEGIKPDDREHIFEPFFTTKDAGRGTGLGLATVHGIVKQHGGSIDLYTAPGGGTTFRIVLRAAVGETLRGEEPESRGEASGGRETIVLVEDDPMVRDLVRTILGKRGYEVYDFEDPRACLDALGQGGSTIDLLLTDVIMPFLNGHELYQHMLVAYPDLPVIYMSGYTDEAIVHHGGLADGIDFLQKPLTTGDLLHMVREVLDRPR